jgi:CRP-like cAMP-binding protein
MKNVLFIFGQLEDADVLWLARHGVVEQVPAGQALIREGEPISDLYVTLDGQFAVGRTSGEIARLGPGEMLGEMSFLEQSRPSADVRAVFASRVLRLRRADLQQRLDEDGEFAARFYRGVALTLSARLRDVYQASLGGTRKPGVLEPDELDPTVMDQVAQAGERFTKLVAALR